MKDMRDKESVVLFKWISLLQRKLYYSLFDIYHIQLSNYEYNILMMNGTLLLRKILVVARNLYLIRHVFSFV